MWITFISNSHLLTFAATTTVNNSRAWMFSFTFMILEELSKIGLFSLEHAPQPLRQASITATSSGKDHHSIGIMTTPLCQRNPFPPYPTPSNLWASLIDQSPLVDSQCPGRHKNVPYVNVAFVRDPWGLDSDRWIPHSRCCEILAPPLSGIHRSESSPSGSFAVKARLLLSKPSDFRI